MKKIIFVMGIVFISTSCLMKNRIYYSDSINKTIHNLEEMQRWLHEDYDYGEISEQVANNYMIVVINSKCSLYKRIGEQHEDCVD